MVDKSARSIADELSREAERKALNKERKELLLTDLSVMDKIVSSLMKDLKLL